MRMRGDRAHGRPESRRNPFPFWGTEKWSMWNAHRIVILTTRSDLIAMTVNPRSAEIAAPGGIGERPARIGARRIGQCRKPVAVSEQEINLFEEAAQK